MSLCCIFINTSQAEVPVFDHYGSKKGLANEPITVITESQDGFIWVGTFSGLFLFDGIDFQRIDVADFSGQIHVQSLLVDHNDGLWIGTKKHGLLFYANNSLSKIELNGELTTSVTEIIQDPSKRIWVGSNKGLFVVEKKPLTQPPQRTIDELRDKKISAVEYLEDNKLVIGVTGGFYLVNLNDDSIEYIPFEEEQLLHIHDLYSDNDHKLWIATSKKLLRFDTEIKQFIQAPSLDKASRVLSIIGDGGDIWVATIEGGVFKINRQDLMTSQYTYQKEFEHSLPEKNIMSLYRSRSDFLWIGGFSKGLSVLSLNVHAFGFETNTPESISCAKNPTIKSLERDSTGDFWLGSNYGLIKYSGNSCEIVEMGGVFVDNEYTVYSTREDGELVWISSSLGLVSYHKKSGKVSSFNEKVATFFSHDLTENKLLVGTSVGLFEFLIAENKFNLLTAPEQKYRDVSYRGFTVNKQGEVFLPTSEGLLYLNKEGLLNKFEDTNHLFADEEVFSVQFNHLNELFVSVKNQGLYHLSHNKEIVKHYYGEGPFSSTNRIYDILVDEVSNLLWLSSMYGIIRLDLTNQNYHIFSGTSDSSHLSLSGTAFKDREGKLYFGGGSGFVGFDSRDINIKNRDTKVVLRDLSLMNDVVKVGSTTGDGFTLSKPISKSNHLDFSYKHKVIKFDFIALNFNKPKSVKYKYKLEPTSSSWVELQKGNRQLIFSDLKAGAYNLNLKATNLDGQWSNAITQLSFNINPAPWFSWQAYVFYLFCLLLSVFLYFHKKVKAHEKINQYLNIQIENKTRSIKIQKQIVEDLMNRKNEIFSNVSHEFRTPITLILGPITELQKSEKDPDKVKVFEMVTRNSERLLRLVNQMLKLAHITEKVEHKKEIINISSRINMIAEAYIHIAAKNKIELIIEDIADVNILVTEDAIESTIGNFLSNAIKYTGSLGQIIIGTHLRPGFVEMYVKDNGCGVSEDKKAHIFKRFGRLSHHQTIPGIGIGLALVKEVAQLNDATISHDSEVGKGSYFSITFPLYFDSAVIEKQISKRLVIEPQKAIKNKGDKETVLIIEDNKDMLVYIMNVLADNLIV